MLALALGTLLAVGALAYVLFPLMIEPSPRPAARGGSSRGRGALPAESESEAVAALREIEFDRATGKLSEADYADLKATYTERALRAMRVAITPPTGADDPIEAAVLAYRAHLKQCARCGPRLEPDAVYCSTCGAYLPGECAACGAPVTEAGAAYCTRCGRQLAA